MFCVKRGKQALLVRYDDPTSIAEEMRPPSLKIWEDVTLFDRNISNPAFSLITYQDSFDVNRGTLRIQDDGKAVFENVTTRELSFLDFHKTKDKNKRLLQRALASSEKKEVPNFHSEQPTLVEPGDLGLDAYWVGALALSRAELTQFMVLYTIVNLPRKDKIATPPRTTIEKLKKKKVSTSLDSGAFLSWYPTAKPASLQTWLSHLKKGVSDSAKEYIHSTLSPVIEGYYRVAPVNFLPEDDGKPVEVMYDDITNMVSKAYFDVGEKTREQDQQFFRPNDSFRGKLTVSTPLCIATPADQDLDWAFSGVAPLGWLFLLPERAATFRRYLLGPVRMPLKGNDAFKASIKQERTANFHENELVQREVEKTYKPLFVDAELNFPDMPCSRALMFPSNKIKQAIQEALARTEVAKESIPERPKVPRGKTLAITTRRHLVREGGDVEDSKSKEEVEEGSRQDVAEKEGANKVGEGVEDEVVAVDKSKARKKSGEKKSNEEKRNEGGDGGEDDEGSEGESKAEKDEEKTVGRVEKADKVLSVRPKQKSAASSKKERAPKPPAAKAENQEPTPSAKIGNKRGKKRKRDMK